MVIKGTVSNLIEPVYYVYIICLDGNTEGIDSVRVINNKYTIKIQTGVTTLVTLFAKDPLVTDNLKDKYMVTLLTEPATVMVSSTDSFSNAKVSGSSAYIEYSKLEEQRELYSRQWLILYESYLKRAEDADKEGMEQLQKSIDSAQEKLYSIYNEYIKAQPSSLLIPYVLDMYMQRLQRNSSDEDVKKVKLIYSKLSTRDKNSYYGRRIEKKLDSYKIRIGMMAPAIVQNDILGRPVSLTSFKGKYVLLDFWASWCGPCRKDFPQLKELYSAYNKYGFEIISISKDTDTSAYLKAIEKDEINIWQNALINDQIMKSFFVAEIPMKFLIDKKGIIIGKWLGGGEENFNSLKSLIEKSVIKNQ